MHIVSLVKLQAIYQTTTYLGPISKVLYQCRVDYITGILKARIFLVSSASIYRLRQHTLGGKSREGIY